MDTIPVGKSIGGAYGFLVGRFFTILGLSWLPAAIYGVGRLAFFHNVIPHILSAAQQGTHPSPVVPGMLLAFILFSLLMVAIIALPLNREALGLHGEPVLARLVVGAPELRLFAAYVRLDIILIALVVALVFGVIGVAMGAKAAVAAWPQLGGWPVLPIVHIAVALIAVLIMLYVAFRLSFLIAPVAAAEDKARLKRAWELSAGNFWRIFAIILAIIVPVFIVMGVCEFALMGSQLRALHVAANGHSDPSAVVSMAVAHAPALVALAAAAIVIVNALFAGAAATAYRALVPAPEPETPAAGEHAETGARIEPFAEPANEPAPELPAQEPVAEAVAVEEAAAHESEPAAEHSAEYPAEPSHEAPAEHAAKPVEPHDAGVPEEAHEPPPEDSAHPDAHPH
jgi:hypothetical protein